MSRLYRILLYGGATSTFGSWLDFIAILMLASYTFQAGPYGMAAVGLFSMLPGIVLAKHLGRICDGANPQKIVLISLIVRILATLGICITSHLLLFLILVAIRSAGNSTTPIAINVISVRAIPQRFIRKFYAQQNILGNVAKVLSPSLGAILVGMHGQNGPLLLAATLCSISLALFFFTSKLNLNNFSTRKTEHPNGLTSGTRPTLGAFITIVAIYFACTFLVNNQLPLIIKKIGFDSYYFAILVGCAGLGNIIGGALSTLFNKRKHYGPNQLLIPAMAQAAGILAYGIAIELAANAEATLLFISFSMGIFSARFAIITGWILADRYASSVGHTSAMVQKWQNMTMLLAPPIGAAILDLGGHVFLFIASGTTGIAAIVISYFSTDRSK